MGAKRSYTTVSRPSGMSYKPVTITVSNASAEKLIEYMSREGVKAHCLCTLGKVAGSSAYKVIDRLNEALKDQYYRRIR